MKVLFKITVHGKNNKIKTYAFIDAGSFISLIDNKLMKKLKIVGTNPLRLKWTGGIERCEDDSQKLTINVSRLNKKKVPINVLPVKELNLLSQSLDYENLARSNPHLKN